MDKSGPPVKRVVCSTPIRICYWLYYSHVEWFANHIFSLATPKGALLLAFLYRFTRKRVYVFFITLSILLLYQLLFFHKLFVFYTLVRKLYDIYNSIYYVLNYYYPYWIPPCIIVVVGKPTIILQRRFFYFYLPLEAFRNHRSNLWYSKYKKTPPNSLEIIQLIESVYLLNLIFIYWYQIHFVAINNIDLTF